MVAGSRHGIWSAIVLTGGTGRRLGGIDKAAVEVGGITLLDHVIDALPAEVPVVVAGPEGPTHRTVAFRAEEPPGAGPVAGIAAALADVGTPYVAIMAVDMPWSAPVVARLVDELAADCAETVDAVIPIDQDGRRQLLCAVWRTHALGAALDRLGDPRGRSVRDLVENAQVHAHSLTPDEASLLVDIDTPDDLERERRRHRGPTLGAEAPRGRFIDEQGADDMAGTDPMDEWIDAVRQELGLESAVDVDVILDVARVAAHNVARPAAPVTTFLLGIAVAGGADLADAAGRIDALAAGWPQAE
jgi:molybdopterin-guanine dinucleotide biosynthesis protein A